jgi:cytochrome c553
MAEYPLFRFVPVRGLPRYVQVELGGFLRRAGGLAQSPYTISNRCATGTRSVDDRTVLCSNGFVIFLVIMKKIIALLSLAGAAALSAGTAIAADPLADELVKPGDPKAAGTKIAMCVGCHGIPGYKATFPEVYQVPMIGGQNAAYIEAALKAYRKGERNHPTMQGIAISLTDQDIADLAAYYAQKTPRNK